MMKVINEEMTRQQSDSDSWLMAFWKGLYLVNAPLQPLIQLSLLHTFLSQERLQVELRHTSTPQGFCVSTISVQGSWSKIGCQTCNVMKRLVHNRQNTALIDALNNLSKFNGNSSQVLDSLFMHMSLVKEHERLFWRYSVCSLTG